MFKYKKRWETLRRDLEELSVVQDNFRRKYLDEAVEADELSRPEITAKAAQHAYASLMAVAIVRRMDDMD